MGCQSEPPVEFSKLAEIVEQFWLIPSQKKL